MDFFKIVTCIFHPLQNQTKLVKAVNAWVRSTSGNVYTFIVFSDFSYILIHDTFQHPFPILLQVLLIEGGNKRERSAVGSYTALIVCPLNGTRTITIATVNIIIVTTTIVVIIILQGQYKKATPP